MTPQEPFFVHLQFKMSEEAKELVPPIMELILNHYSGRGFHRSHVTSSLEALAVVASCLIVGGGPTALPHFYDAVGDNVALVLRQMEEATGKGMTKQ